MKHCTQLVFAVICTFIIVNCTAQKPSSAKTFLFKNYPASINCTEAQLNSLFSNPDGLEVSLSLPGNLTLNGPVKWWAKKYSSLQTVSIQLTSFHNILFSLTRRYDAANNIIYVGHLFSADYADGYELKRTAGNNYQLVKIETDKMLPICSRY